jgi:hypothetical protein
MPRPDFCLAFNSGSFSKECKIRKLNALPVRIDHGLAFHVLIGKRRPGRVHVPRSGRVENAHRF